MIAGLLNAFDNKFAISSVAAHCDIPCKIYDPIIAQIACLSVLRFIDIIQELSDKPQLTVADYSQLSRLTREKEIHASNVKEEIRVIWGDYFKAPQLEQFPNTHSLVHEIMLTASACKQHITRDKAEHLLSLVNEFADSFWRSKNLSTYTATCPYPPSEKVVYPRLSTE
jgi:nickel superoxide dismutase